MDTLSRLLRNLNPMFFMNNKGFSGPEGEGENAAAEGEGSAEGQEGNEGGQDSVETPWYQEVFGEGVKEDSEVTKYKTPEEFYNGYKSKVEMLGKKGVIVPDDNASEEVKENFKRAIGVPEKAEEYKFSEVENIHPSIENPDEIKKGLADYFHSIGVPQNIADNLHGEFLNMLTRSAELQETKQKEAMQKAESELRQEWGPEYEQNRSAVGKFAAKIGGQEFIDAMGGQEGLGNNPIVMKVLAKVSRAMSEDQLQSIAANPVTNDGGANVTQAEAEKAYTSIGSGEGELGKAFMDESHPKHFEAVKERSRLAEIAFPDKKE